MELKQSLNDYKSRVNTVEATCNQNNDKVEGLEMEHESAKEVVAEIKINSVVQEDKIETLINLVIRQDEVINELSNRITQLVKRSMQANVIISGIPEMNGEDCVSLANEFFRDKLHLNDIKISTAHRIGVGEVRSIVVRLANAKDKYLIFRSSSQLKAVADPGFPEGGRQGPTRRCSGRLVCKNERIWSLRGARAGGPPSLDPPM